MIRERQESIRHKRPTEPSLVIWLMAGVVALLSGVLLFWLHIFQLLGALQIYDIRLLSAIPLLLWLILLCLRVWLYNMMFHLYWQEINEAEKRKNEKKK
ncbi:hypothetical protein [uncultured Cedecea sp.]|uniref:hypothetical protein n=1 Tax=uncultured Cedecea sp. TaxID=988762 RepID=UPI00261AA94C|nr:hypothetical protein [uncultured Cedecea sp.]